MNFRRSSGILLPVISLPGKYGIGKMGNEARNFIDKLSRAGQKLWQICPLGHTAEENSPYICFSAFAGNPLLIDPEQLVQERLLSGEDIKKVPAAFGQAKINYPAVKKHTYQFLEKAAANFLNDKKHVKALTVFEKEKAYWLHDYAFFMSLYEHFDRVSWQEWPQDIKKRNKKAVDHYHELLSDRILFYKVVQYLFSQQWKKLKTYANEQGVSIVGDIPIYISIDSSDAWANPKNFLFDSDLRPTHVAGVPPDYFSETGQLWGNPIYNWRYMKRDDFSWWVEVFRNQINSFDFIRIDHFRGFAAYWKIPYGEKTAVKGEWEKAPGEELFSTVLDQFGDLPFFAEDLGYITPDVVELRDRFGFMGMYILQFGFDHAEESMPLPHAYREESVVYTGTHDNDTGKGWFTNASAADKRLALDYLNCSEDEIVPAMIRMVWSSHARWAVIPMQDLLELSSSSRLNIPGVYKNIYRWRMDEGAFTTAKIKELASLTKLYGR